MSIVWADVTAIAAAVSTLPVATQTVILAIVDRQIDDTEWLDLADDGRRYLAAHLATVYSQGAGAGAVTSETLGPMSRSYGLPPGVTGELATTPYGVFYLHLLKLLPASLGFVP